MTLAEREDHYAQIIGYKDFKNLRDTHLKFKPQTRNELIQGLKVQINYYRVQYDALRHHVYLDENNTPKVIKEPKEPVSDAVEKELLEEAIITVLDNNSTVSDVDYETISDQIIKLFQQSKQK